ncbi:MAG: hypothetical protein Q8N55_00400, partial [bacterium]|nr:hypothetical protein [bacterium]
MKITFVNLKREMHSNHPVHLYAPLDLGYCISLAEREGHEVFFIDANVKCYDKNKVISLIKESKCQAVVIKPEINTESLALDITSKISNDVIYKIIIGPVATMQYKDFIFKGSPINFLILEEPEMTFLELIRQLDSRKN